MPGIKMTFIALLLTAVALEAKQPGQRYRILSECDAAAEVRADVPLSTKLEIRYSIAGTSTCYSVAATVGGKQVRGYVFERDLAAVRAFESQRAADEEAAFRAPLEIAPTTSAAPAHTQALKEASDSAKPSSRARPKPKKIDF